MRGALGLFFAQVKQITDHFIYMEILLFVSCMLCLTIEKLALGSRP
ncbi:hypothetical protein MNBD_ALPHA11-1621 [hydrothermal vent metagenome]|uniref:Uncharacterized protein n=1 Tax=hydrothermal vent metagenome TaxID=652676 RepID=A0A3B0UI34_9ZZZZ